MVTTWAWSAEAPSRSGSTRRRRDERGNTDTQTPGWGSIPHRHAACHHQPFRKRCRDNAIARRRGRVCRLVSSHLMVSHETETAPCCSRPKVKGPRDDPGTPESCIRLVEEFGPGLSSDAEERHRRGPAPRPALLDPL